MVFVRHLCQKRGHLWLFEFLLVSGKGYGGNTSICALSRWSLCNMFTFVWLFVDPIVGNTASICWSQSDAIKMIFEIGGIQLFTVINCLRAYWTIFCSHLRLINWGISAQVISFCPDFYRIFFFLVTIEVCESVIGFLSPSLENRKPVHISTIELLCHFVFFRVYSGELSRSLLYNSYFAAIASFFWQILKLRISSVVAIHRILIKSLFEEFKCLFWIRWWFVLINHGYCFHSHFFSIKDRQRWFCCHIDA